MSPESDLPGALAGPSPAGVGWAGWKWSKPRAPPPPAGSLGEKRCPVPSGGPTGPPAPALRGARLGEGAAACEAAGRGLCRCSGSAPWGGTEGRPRGDVAASQGKNGARSGLQTPGTQSAGRRLAGAHRPGTDGGSPGTPQRRHPRPRPHLRCGHAPADPLAAAAARQASPRVPPPSPERRLSARGGRASATQPGSRRRPRSTARPLPARGRRARLSADHAPAAPAAGPPAVPAGGRPRLRPPPRGECPPGPPEAWQLGAGWGRRRRETRCWCGRRCAGREGTGLGVSPPPGAASDRVWTGGTWSRAPLVPRRAHSPQPALLRAASGAPAGGSGCQRAPHPPSVLWPRGCEERELRGCSAGAVVG